MGAAAAAAAAAVAAVAAVAAAAAAAAATTNSPIQGPKIHSPNEGYNTYTYIMYITVRSHTHASSSDSNIHCSARH